MRPLYYKLDEDHNPVPCSLEEFTKTWRSHRQVRETYVGKDRISTVFLGIDHGFLDDTTPILFETMVFGGPLDGEQKRYCTWNEAMKGHYATVERVRKARAQPFRRLWSWMKEVLGHG